MMSKTIIRILSILEMLAMMVLLFLLSGREMTAQLCDIEHDSLFCLDAQTFCSIVSHIGGLADWIGLYLIQFFSIPHWGIVTFLLPMILGVLGLMLILRHVDFPIEGYPLCFGLAFLCLLVSFDSNSFFQGQTALSMSLLLLGLVSLVPSKNIRNVLFICLTPVAFCLFGAASALYVICGLLVFVKRDNLWPLASLALQVMMVLWCIFSYALPSSSHAFSPAAYYNTYQPEMPFIQWGGWIFAVLFVAAARILMVIGTRGVSWKRYIVFTLVLLVLYPLYSPLYLKYRNSDTQKSLWEMSDYAFKGDWASVLETVNAMPVISNHIVLNYAYLAMGHLGTLEKNAFSILPHDQNSLIVLQSEDKDSYAVRSDINMLIGNVAAAQHDAFERISYCAPHFQSVRCIRRLIETNIAQHHDKVALKYISMLEKTMFYRDMAMDYRIQLRDKSLRGYDGNNRFIMLDGWYPEMDDLIEAQPENRNAVLYEGLSFLFAKNINMFMEFYQKNCDKPSMNPLAEVFQQAVVVYYQQNEEAWKENGVSDGIIERYKSFRDAYMKNRRSAGIKSQMRRGFGDTLWYYLLFGR